MTIQLPTVYGQMLVSRYDINQTHALLKTGRSPEHNEIEILAGILKVLPADPVFIDVGANFGCFTLAMAPLCKTVHAFEPQRILFNMLSGSVAINSLTNIYLHNAAVGAIEGRVELPQFDYERPLNFGSIEFGPTQREPLTQMRGNDPSRIETVPLITIDSLELSRVDMMKIDVEGMECEVIEGAIKTIERCRPVMLVEMIKCDAQALCNRVGGLGYAVHLGVNDFLCIPNEMADKITVRVA